MDSQMTTSPTTCLTMSWVEVSDASGRTRLEARWASPAPATSKSHAA